MKLKSMQHVTKKPHGGGWQDKLKALCVAHNHLKMSGKGNASYRSQEARVSRLYNIFETLRKDLHFGIEDPSNLKPKHVVKLVAFWVAKGLAASTIDNNLTVLRMFCGWINKTGMVHSLDHYAPDLKRTYAATHDKSWSGNVEDPWVLWDRVYQKDKNVGIQLLIGMAFGARLKEMNMFKPFVHAHETFVEFYEGAKGGRPRNIEITNEFQRVVLDIAKTHIKNRGGRPQSFLGNPDKTLKQNLTRFSTVMTACGITKDEVGVTAHGLRVEFTLSELEKRGLVPSVRAAFVPDPNRLATRMADIHAMVSESDEKATGVDGQFEKTLGYLQVSEMLGHSRVPVMTAYSGPIRPTEAQKEMLSKSQKRKNPPAGDETPV